VTDPYDDAYLLYRLARYRAHLVAGQCRQLFRIVASGLFKPASKADTVNIEISAAQPNELGLVYSSWKMSALDAPHNDPLKSTGMVGQHFTRYNRDVQRVMQTQPLILVAREQSDPSFAYGWICAGLYDGDLAILYVYTKYKFRRLGIARDLRDAVLSRSPDNVRPVYCAKSAHDEVFEDWGFTFRELDDVLGTSERRAG
jgi:hypothetical protein